MQIQEKKFILENELKESGWLNLYEKFKKTKEYQQIKSFLKAEENKNFNPGFKNIFKSLYSVNFSYVKVVIVGKEPTTQAHQATGLAFGSAGTMPPSPPLFNIFKELKRDLNISPGKDNTLEGWADQGVLLLNSILTIDANNLEAHRSLGWEVFTDMVVRELSDRSEKLVFVLWGDEAHKKESFINKKKHATLKAGHPGPETATMFIGCGHFSQINNILVNHFQKEPIDWSKTEKNNKEYYELPGIKSNTHRSVELKLFGRKTYKSGS